MAAPADGSGDGPHAYEFRALDAAGNESATGSCTVRIDTQGPAVTPTGLQPDSHSGWRTTSQTEPRDRRHGGSGVAATYYTLDGGPRAHAPSR